MLSRGRICGVVFDLDGVLIDSTECHRSAFEEVLRPLGIQDFEYSQYAGWRTAEVVEAVLRRAGLAAESELVASTAERKTLLARAKMAAVNPRREGCPEILEKLAEMGYALALASSGSRGSVEAFLDVNNCRGIFRSVLTGGDVVRAKPDPEIYAKTFELLGLEPGTCVVVEDAVSGIQAACRAGAVPIGITGTSGAEALRDSGACAVVDRLLEIPAALLTI
jgi:beta-phosphoglucomutase